MIAAFTDGRGRAIVYGRDVVVIDLIEFVCDLRKLSVNGTHRFRKQVDSIREGMILRRGMDRAEGDEQRTGKALRQYDIDGASQKHGDNIIGKTDRRAKKKQGEHPAAQKHQHLCKTARAVKSAGKKGGQYQHDGKRKKLRGGGAQRART